MISSLYTMDELPLPLAQGDRTGKVFRHPKVGSVIEKGEIACAVPHFESCEAAVA
jgi:hypothetical protein